METILARLKRGDLLVTDGAMGTMLMARGLQPGACPEGINLERPELLEEIAGLYLEAGADIVQTNTFGGHPAKLASYGLADRAVEVNARAVEAARRAVKEAARGFRGARRPALVAASCGPSARLLRPYGDADPTEIGEGFALQCRALVAAGADMICVETMTDLAEASLAVRAAKSASPSTPVIATMTFDRTPRGFFTIMGVTIERACSGLEEAGADILGSNCGNGIEAMIEIAREFRRHTRLPLCFRSNAGLPQARGGAVVYPETPAFMADRTGALLDAGASIVGGCCGTTPEHTRSFRRVVDDRAGSPG